MKLTELKRLAARRGMEISFATPAGLECVVDSKGIARVPGLHGPPGFNLETCAAGAVTFTVRSGPGSPARQASPAEVEQLVASLSGQGPVAADHDE